MKRNKLHFKEMDQYEKIYCGRNEHDEEMNSKQINEALFIDAYLLKEKRN